jgi:hypothetical protein
MILHWILVISGCCAVVGFWAYVLEVLQDRISIRTKWSDLSGYQWEVTLLTIVGAIVFLGTLITGAILK